MSPAYVVTYGTYHMKWSTTFVNIDVHFVGACSRGVVSRQRPKPKVRPSAVAVTYPIETRSINTVKMESIRCSLCDTKKVVEASIITK